ncbi:hypothetical protein [[Acholeplasma] multilocale]|uniref:hypothetical protein n=1 Tax=[Acholeplasma] multilocale TaxID=264638 RepID=UPI00055198D2|nr:hypothetical protein [[Acholeplasma] multilocale]
MTKKWTFYHKKPDKIVKINRKNLKKYNLEDELPDWVYKRQIKNKAIRLKKFKKINLNSYEITGFWERKLNYFKNYYIAVIAIMFILGFAVTGTIQLFVKSDLLNPSNALNLKIEELNKVKDNSFFKNKEFNIKTLDEYIKEELNLDIFQKQITEIYGNINDFKKEDNEIVSYFNLNTLDNLINDPMIKNSFFDKYNKALIYNFNLNKILEKDKRAMTVDEMKKYSELGVLEKYFDDFYRKNIKGTSKQVNIQRFNQLEILSSTKDVVETDALLANENLSEKDKLDLSKTKTFMKNMQVNFKINNLWYRYLGYSFKNDLNSFEIKEKQAYFKELKEINGLWLTNMEKELYKVKNGVNKWFWEVDGYNNKLQYDSKVKFLHKFKNNQKITRAELKEVLIQDNFFKNNFNTKEKVNIDDFWIKYNGYSKIEQKNEGTKENPKYSWRNYYKFTFISKNDKGSFELNIADNNFRIENLDFDVELKYNDIFENYQNEYLIDLVKEKQSWFILFEIF